VSAYIAAKFKKINKNFCYKIIKIHLGKKMKKLLVLLCSMFVLCANAQNFPYKNRVWASPSCDAPETIRTWWDFGDGALTLFFTNKENRLSVGVISKLSNESKYGAGSFFFEYKRLGIEEDYTFYTDNTAKLRERTVNGKVIVKDSVVTSDSTPVRLLYSCDLKTKAVDHMLEDIALHLKQKNESIDQHVAAKSKKEACYPSGNYKIFNYSDGRKARNVDEMRGIGDEECACWISDQTGENKYEIYPSLRNDDPLAIRKPYPLNLWSIYTKQKYPFGGCPTENDYKQIVQSMNNQKKQEEVKNAQEAEKQKNQPKLTKAEIAEIKKICQVMVDKNNSAEDACASAGDPNRCIKIKRNKILTDLKINDLESRSGILTICGSLGFPINIFSWGLD